MQNASTDRRDSAEIDTNQARSGFDESRFRQVLSHYPTGVAVVTAHTDEGHLGMVIGSFTSVSMRPPLVAFLADHKSRTYAQLKKASHFIINILAADQEHLCRRFASKSIGDKWVGLTWKPASNGVRKITEAIAHIECSHSVTHAAGDHDIVVCRVVDLVAENPGLPLLFFRGSYGKFAPTSLSMPTQLETPSPLCSSDAGCAASPTDRSVAQTT
jgi:flavin reductase (DIM6/NTAB) family NADH-FMN oxidoreductase RutF